jgi:hypothetical protein
VQQSALAELAYLVADLDARAAAVHEVELVLLVVPVAEAFVAGREDDDVRAERCHAECATHLAKAVAVSEFPD